MPTPDGSSTTTAIPLTGNTGIDGLLHIRKWGGTAGTNATISYSFPTSPLNWSRDPNGGYGDPSKVDEPDSALFRGLTSTEQVAVAGALQQWANVANVQFVPVQDNTFTVGDIRVAVTGAVEPGFAAHAYIPSPSPKGGDVWLGSSTFAQYTASDLAPGGRGFIVLLHEIGHALGLKHPHEAEDGNPVTLSGTLDSVKFTVMSTFEARNGTSVSPLPSTPMLYDIRAIQYIYGKNSTFNAGNDTYDFFQGQSYYQTIWDGGGIDTIRYNAATQGGRISLQDGTFSELGNPIRLGSFSTQTETVAIAFDAIIENAIGGNGNDTILGNAFANSLTGTSGNDSLDGVGGNDALDGGTGNDSLTGGPGEDTLNGGPGIDVVVFVFGQGQYTLSRFLDGSYSISGPEGLDRLVDIELLQFAGGAPVSIQSIPVALTIIGDGGNNFLVGGGAGDSIDGGFGDDTLFGLDGSDTVIGGFGNDFIVGGTFFEVGSDIVDAGPGNDFVFGGGGNDTLTGGPGNDLIAGEPGDDSILGGDGDNALYGGGGNDTIQGGVNGDIVFGELGRDVIVTADGLDLIIGDGNDIGEADFINAGEGPDFVFAGAGDDTILGQGGPDFMLGENGNDSMSGGDGDDFLPAGQGNDIIDGGGGNDLLVGEPGADTIDGGPGIDTAKYSGARSDYSVSVAGGSATVVDLRLGSPDGTDQLTNVESLWFSDQLIPISAPLPTVSISNATVNEGNSGTTNAVFSISLSAPASSPVSIVATTSSGSATAGSDFISTTSTTTIPAGQISATFNVPVIGDAINEPNETFNVTLSNPIGATIGDGLGAGTITNDDGAAALPSVSITSASIAEGSSGSILNFTVNLSSPTNQQVSVTASTSNGTATAGSDYLAKTATVVVPVGQTIATFSVVVFGDELVEPNETFTVSLSNPLNATLGGQSTAIGTLLNDDSAVQGVIGISPSAFSAADFVIV